MHDCLVREALIFAGRHPPTQTASSWRVRANDDTSSAKFGKVVAWTHRTVEWAREVVIEGLRWLESPSMNRFS